VDKEIERKLVAWDLSPSLADVHKFKAEGPIKDKSARKLVSEQLTNSQSFEGLIVFELICWLKPLPDCLVD
jgi:hypothetical protein